MRYAIVGAGPAGLAVGTLLADSGHAVTVFEKKDRIGGSWKGSFQGGYFTENSPRVLIGTAEGFFDYLGLTRGDFVAVYGGALRFNVMVLSFFFSSFSAGDWWALGRGAVAGVRGDITLETWIAVNNMSRAGARALEIFCIAMNDIPSKTNAREFFNTITVPETTGARQFRDPNRWSAIAARRIESRANCGVVVNSEVTGVFGSADGTLARGVLVNGRYEFADRVILCTQATGLVPILRGTPFERNWPMVKDEWARATSYYAFGFQIHFDRPVKRPGSWCWSCAGPWTVIVLPVDWLDELSMDPSIREVWSCCIVDMETPSPFAGGRCANEIADADTVVRECIRQVRASARSDISPKVVTLSSRLYHDGQRWVSGESGFTSGVHRRVPIRGAARNLFALGSFSESDRPITAQFGSSINAVVRYLDMYDPGVRRFRSDGGAITGVAVILVLALIGYRKKN